MQTAVDVDGSDADSTLYTVHTMQTTAPQSAEVTAVYKSSVYNNERARQQPSEHTVHCIPSPNACMHIGGMLYTAYRPPILSGCIVYIYSVPRHIYV